MFVHRLFYQDQILLNWGQWERNAQICGTLFHAISFFFLHLSQTPLWNFRYSFQTYEFVSTSNCINMPLSLRFTKFWSSLLFWILIWYPEGTVRYSLVYLKLKDFCIQVHIAYVKSIFKHRLSKYKVFKLKKCLEFSHLITCPL